MPQQDVTITAWPDKPLTVTHRTEPGSTPSVDMNMNMRADRPVPVCFTLCEPICARSDYSIGISIFDNPVVRIRLVGETRIQPCGDRAPTTPGRPDCVDFTTLERGRKLRGKFEHDGAVVELAAPTETVDVGGTIGVRVPDGGIRVTFAAPVTSASVRLLAPEGGAVEGRAGESLVTTVNLEPSAGVQQVDVPGLALTAIVVTGSAAVLFEVCGRHADERDRIF